MNGFFFSPLVGLMLNIFTFAYNQTLNVFVHYLKCVLICLFSTMSVSRYEFFEKLELDQFLQEPEETPATYTLHAVLVHSGKFSSNVNITRSFCTYQ